MASSARRDRAQQRHLQDGLGHTTPLMCDVVFTGRMVSVLLWWALLQGPSHSCCFLCARTDSQTGSYVQECVVWRWISDAASLSDWRWFQAFDSHCGSFHPPPCHSLCVCLHLWRYSRPPEDVTAVHVCLHLESECTHFKSSELIWIQQCAARSRWSQMMVSILRRFKVDTYE